MGGPRTGPDRGSNTTSRSGPRFKHHLPVFLNSKVSYVNSVKVCHRDITASNILINKETLLVKVIDFGLAVETNPQASLLTPTGFKSNRPPEMMFFNEYDEKIDEWMAGITFLKLITRNLSWTTKRILKAKRNGTQFEIKNETV